jgi:hypothetical protein
MREATARPLSSAGGEAEAERGATRCDVEVDTAGVSHFCPGHRPVCVDGQPQHDARLGMLEQGDRRTRHIDMYYQNWRHRARFRYAR